jgi:hypothetical protein
MKRGRVDVFKHRESKEMRGEGMQRAQVFGSVLIYGHKKAPAG